MTEVFSAIFSTSGTTGDPTPAPYAGRGPSMLVREFWELGSRPGDYFTYCLFTFRGPGIHDTIRGIGATPVFVDHQPADVPQLVRFSRELRPTAWYNLSGPLVLALEQHAARADVDLAEAFSSYRGVTFAGEPIGPRARRLVEDGWGLELFMHTGVGDVGAATECREHDGCHFWEDTCYLESLDPDGAEPVGDGERGELVSTTLLDKIAPLVRYRSDDLVRITHEQCACGRTHGRVWPLGRKGDEVVVDGRSVLPGDLWEAVERVPETSAGLFQVIRAQAGGRPAPAPRRVRSRGRCGASPTCRRGSPSPCTRRSASSPTSSSSRTRCCCVRARRTRSRGWRSSDMVMFAKRYEDPPGVWGVGRVVVDGEVVPWPVAQADVEDEAESLAPRLSALGSRARRARPLRVDALAGHARRPVGAGGGKGRRAVLVGRLDTVRRVPRRRARPAARAAGRARDHR